MFIVSKYNLLWRSLLWMCCLWAGLPILVPFNILAVTVTHTLYWISLLVRTVWSATACAIFMFACIVCTCYIIPFKIVAVFHCRNNIVSYLIWCCCFLSHSTSTQISSNFNNDNIDPDGLYSDGDNTMQYLTFCRKWMY